MDTWYSHPLGDGIMAFEPKETLREQFLAQFEAAGRPVAMAVFTRHELEGHLQCEAVAYFSPAASSLALAVGARACERPTVHELDLLAGDPTCWAALFPVQPGESTDSTP